MKENRFVKGRVVGQNFSMMRGVGREMKRNSEQRGDRNVMLISLDGELRLMCGVN